MFDIYYNNRLSAGVASGVAIQLKTLPSEISRKCQNWKGHSLAQSLPFRNEFLVISIKNYEKAVIKVSRFCPILLGFLLLARLFCPIIDETAIFVDHSILNLPRLF